MKKIYFIVIILLFIGCDDQEDAEVCGDPFEPGFDIYPILSTKFSTVPILEGRQKIHVPSYTYYVNDRHPFTMAGDEELMQKTLSIDHLSDCQAVGMVGNNSVTPTLQWSEINSELIVAAIFTKEIRHSTNSESVQNYVDAVWGWHSKLTGNSSGVTNGSHIVEFNDGRAIIDGRISDTQMADTLDENRVYFWAVWAWDKQAQKITAASSQIPFITNKKVNDMPLRFYSPFQLNGTWKLVSARNLAQEDITLSFPIQKFKVDAEVCEPTFILETWDADNIEQSTSVYFDGSRWSLFNEVSLQNFFTSCYEFTALYTSEQLSANVHYRRE